MLVWDADSGLSGDPELVEDVTRRASELGRDMAHSLSIWAVALELVTGVETGGDIPTND